MHPKIKTLFNSHKMKKILINSVFIASALLAVVSCKKTEGPLYAGPENRISFFNTSKSLVMANGVLEVPVGRTSSTGTLSIPISLSASGAGYTNVFKMAGPVQFENGQAQSVAQVKYSDFSSIDPSTLSVTAAANNNVNVGLAFPFKLTIAPDDVSPANRSTIEVLASSQLEFDNGKMTEMNSTDGWAEDILDVKVEKAIGANVYKVVSPFNANSFAFMIKSDGKTVICPNQVIAQNATYGPVTMSGVTGTYANGIVTLKVTGYTVSAGSFGSGVEIIKIP